MKCSVKICDREAHVKGLCHAHYHRQRYWGGLQPEKPIGARRDQYNNRWAGGVTRHPDGRVLVRAKNHPYPNQRNGYVFRYRLVMEKHIGRILLPSEIVHHKNQIVDDDRIENLQITNRVDHLNHHRPQLTAARLRKRAKTP